MKKIIPLTALALGLSGGVALADRGHENHSVTVDHRGGPRGNTVVREHDGNWRGNNVVVRDHDRGWRGNNVVVREHDRDWRGGNVVVRDRDWNRGGYNNRVVVRDRDDYRRGYYRRPIYAAYGSRPIIRERYYNYYQRPSLLIENYDPMPGYYWVAGTWTWDGGEWIWQPGHYQPDQSYVDPGYGSY